MISFLTPLEQEQYAQARAKALAHDSDLKTEGETLMQQGKEVMTSGTMADKQAFMEKMNSHRQKLREAMLKEDPTLEPVFVKIDQNISELKAKATERLHEMQKSNEATNASTAAPPADK